MARNRKRAKERRDRRPQTVSRRSGLAAARVDAAEAAPSPLEHAAPDAELVDAQLALGAGLVADGGLAADGELGVDEEPIDGGQADEGPLEEEYEPTDAGVGGSPPRSLPPRGGGALPPGGGGAVALPGAGGVPEARAPHRSRLVAFLEGSWRELQRVQWPDRRQVMQATAVVIGFVIVAGIFLAVADTAASHLMSYILTGH